MSRGTYLKEAHRYLSNAREILKKAGRLNGYYKDPKYVRIACGAAYHGVILAADAYLAKKGHPILKKKGSRKNVDDYRQLLVKFNRKILNNFNTAYNIFYLSGYYDGELNAKIIKTGFDSVEEIIRATE